MSGKSEIIAEISYQYTSITARLQMTSNQNIFVQHKLSENAVFFFFCVFFLGVSKFLDK